MDGWRILAYKDRDRVRLVSRNGIDHTRRFRDIAAAISKLSARMLVLDGEVAIYDQQFRSRFEWLRDPDLTAVVTPPIFIAFDLVYRGGRDLSARPPRERRARLEDVVAGSELVFPVRQLAPEVDVYEGGPTRRWLKVKQKGWTVGEDQWRRRISVTASAKGRRSTSRRSTAVASACARRAPEASVSILGCPVLSRRDPTHHVAAPRRRSP